MFQELFVCFRKRFLIGKCQPCKMTEESGTNDDVGYDGNSLPVDIKNPERSSSEYVYILVYEILH